MNSFTVGSFYKASGKFDLILSIIVTIVASIIAVALGAGYAYLSDLNPIIYLNVLLLVGVFFAIATMTNLVTGIAKSRNRIVNILIALILGVVAYYAHWAYLCAQIEETGFLTALISPLSTFDSVFQFMSIREITISKRGNNGVTLSGTVLQVFYAIEFLFFIVPAALATAVDYFCENCKTAYESYELFTAHDDLLEQQVTKGHLGQYAFIDGLDFEKNHGQLLREKNGISLLFKLNYHQCPKCKDNSLLNINQVAYEYEKGEFKEKDDKSLVTGVYIDQETNQILARQI